MDHVSEYAPMFLAEGREHLQELNLAVVRPEIREASARSAAAVLSDGQIAVIVDCDAVAQTPQPTIPQGAAA